MRSVLWCLLLVAASVLGVEDVTQSFVVTGNQHTFTMLDENFNRGDNAWRIVRTFNANQNSNDARALLVANGSLHPRPFPQSYIDNQAAQTRPLIDCVNLRYSLLVGAVSLEARPPEGSRTYRYTKPFPNFAGTETITYTYFDAGAEFTNQDDDTALLRVTVSFISPNSAPSISLSGSPPSAVVGVQVTFTATTSDPNGDTVAVSYAYGDGQTGASNVHTYAAAGSYTCTATADDGHGGTATASTVVTITAQPVNGLASPVASLSASPTVLAVGQTTQFTPLCNLSATFSMDYGDGITGTPMVYSYAAPGTYNAKALAVTTNGNTSASVLIQVYGAASIPAAAFNSDIVGFVGLPMSFDAITSTDLENRLVSYVWDFGDGSPSGFGAQISKRYLTAATYTVSLTVTDAQGLSNTASREIEVLPADQIGVFDTEVEYSARFNLNIGQTNRDYVKFFARVNVGEIAVGNNTAVSVAINGKVFSGTLNRRKIATATGIKFRVKHGERRQSSGACEITLLARNQSGLGSVITALLGSVANETAVVPVVFSVGSKSFSVNVISEYEVPGLLKGKLSGVYE